MVKKVIGNFLVVSTFIISCHAFWWSPASTTEPPIKHIPLGYFRTYTYQPVGAPSPYSFSIVGTAANPFNWAARIPSLPILSKSKPKTTTEHNTSPPTTTTSTTTTTTTTTEPPTPSPQPSTTPQSQFYHDRLSQPLTNSANLINSGGKYIDQMRAENGGMFNRRNSPYYQSQGNFYRPYQYPEFSASNQRSTVQFVPCMCPISLGSTPLDLGESRTIPEGEEVEIQKTTDETNENENTADNIVDLEEDIEKKSVR